MQSTYIGLMKKQIRNSQEQDNTKRLQQGHPAGFMDMVTSDYSIWL